MQTTWNTGTGSLEPTTYWNSLFRGNYIGVSATALLFYEYFLILPQEIKYIWRHKKSIALYLFLVNRYVVLSLRGLRLIQVVLWAGHNERTADKICTAVWRVGDAGTIIMYLVLALFASLRTYAIWEKNRKVLICVLLLGLVYPVGFCYSVTTRTYRAAPPPFTGCVYYTSLKVASKLDPNEIYSILGIVFSMIFEATVVVLTWLKTVTLLRHRRQIEGRIDQGMGYILLRDGTTHFAALVVLNGIGLITFTITPFDFIAPMTDTMISILVSRLILNLRQDFLGANTRRTSDDSQRLAARGSHRDRGNGIEDVSNITLRFNHNTTEASSTDYIDRDFHAPARSEVGSGS